MKRPILTSRNNVVIVNLEANAISPLRTAREGMKLKFNN